MVPDFLIFFKKTVRTAGVRKMMGQKKLSVIIPVYNGETVLPRAVQAVLREPGEDYELLLIDDGSTDETPKICDGIAAQDRRVRVFHTKNQGQGIARNLGITQARGEYLLFCDADDTMVWQGVRRLLEVAAERTPDVICAVYERVGSQGRERIGTNLTCGSVSRSGTREEQRRYHQIKTSNLFGYVWNKLYRRQFLLERQLRFDDIRKVYMEDTLFNLKVFSQCPSYYLEPVVVYEYDISGESTTRGMVKDIAQRNAHMLRQYDAYLKAQNLQEENMDLFVPLAMRVICWSLVKNIPYEGASFRGLKEKIAVFLREDSVRRMLANKSHCGQLRHLPSLPQRIFYSFLFRFLPVGEGSLAASVFLAGYPLMKWYIKRSVK